MTTPPPFPGWQPGDYRPPPPPGWRPTGDYRPPVLPPKPPPGKRSWLIAAGCLALVIVLIAVANSSASSSSGAGDGSDQGSSSGSNPASAANVATAGQVARDGDFAFRVTGMSCGHAAADAVYNAPDLTGTKPAGTRECIVRLRVTDNKNEAQP